MCGVFGYWTTKKSAIKTNGMAANELGQHGLRKVVEGLQKLEYRGYDSWGLAFPLDNIVETHKSLGALPTANAEAFDLPVPYALGHTRWATHGVVNLENCHPHVSQCGRFALVHNGIVENEQALRAELKLSGACLQGDTDTEVVLRLLERTLTEQKNAQEANNIPAALRTVFKRLKGRNTLVLMAIE